MLIILLVLTIQITSSLTSTSHILTTISQCGSAIGRSCTYDSTCQSRVDNAVCLNGKCACQTGYIQDGKYRCIPSESTLTTTFTTTTTSVIYDSVIGGSCESNTNCQGLVSNAICLNGICACRTGYVPDGLFNCIPSESSVTTTTPILIYDSVIGGFCESHTNCQGLVNNAFCLNGKCACEPGYIPNGRYSCILSENSTPIFTTTTSVIIYDSIIGGSCESNTNCQGLVNNALCLDGTCTCDTGYTPNGVLQCAPNEE